jgi:membrane-bound lytic murein transglycosylase A
LAVDKHIHVYGTPIWVDADLPIDSEKPETKFQRLLFAQDTGSAIVGPARADIYFGHGEEISHVAGRIKQFGKFVMLVPRSIAVSGTAVAAATDVPLPKPRPLMTVTAAARAATGTTGSIPASMPKRRP